MDRLCTERHPGDWETMAVKAEVWVEAVYEGWAEVHGRVEGRRGRRG